MSLFEDFFAEHVADIDVEYQRIQKEAKQGIWTTKSGEHIAVSDMTDVAVALLTFLQIGSVRRQSQYWKRWR